MTHVGALPAQLAPPPTTRGRRMFAPVAVIGGLGLATLALHLRDPHEQGSWGLCPSAAMGVYCPGCGGLRAVNDLTNGHLGAALSSNVLVTVMVPLVSLWLLVWAVDSWRGVRREVDIQRVTRGAYVVLAVALAFTVLRNISVGAWLAP